MLPVGDFVRTRRVPFLNWSLIAINFAVFFYTVSLSTDSGTFRLSAADRFFLDWGTVPACLADFAGIHTDVSPRDLAIACQHADRAPLQLVTSMFLHAGWLHILGNMLFLWIFGDNVEDRLGHARYLVFYFACGIVAALFQAFMSLDTLAPAVGASGAIAGVLAGYLLLYPTARVRVIILPLFFIPFLVPAVVLILVWFVSQLFSGLAELGQTAAGSGVAWWAHVGGFVAGALLVMPLKLRERQGRRLAALSQPDR